MGAVEHLAPEQALQLLHPLACFLVGDHAASVALAKGRELVVHERHGVLVLSARSCRARLRGKESVAARAGGPVATLLSSEILSF